MAEVRYRMPPADNQPSNPSNPASKEAPTTKSTPARRHNSPNRATQDAIISPTSPLVTLIFGPGILLALLGYAGYHFYHNSTLSGKALARPNHERFPGNAKHPAPASAAAAGDLSLTDSELLAFTGADATKDIYVALNGTIYNVTASPSFYGPSGPYGHFAGRDASRGWVTECWDEPEQLTWDLAGVEAMFMPRYLDEEMEDAAQGKLAGDAGVEGSEAVEAQARKVVERIGGVGPALRAERRVLDEVEALDGVQRGLAHWVAFFEGNPKYGVVGAVDPRERVLGGPVPDVCEAALKKRPIKGGKLQHVLDSAGPAMAGGQQAGAAAGGQQAKPDFVQHGVRE